MSQATYQLHIDLDRDGFFCDGVLGSDPINQLPSPVLWHGLYFAKATSNSVVATSAEATDYGTQKLIIDTGGDVGGGVYIGQHPDTGTKDSIVISAGGFPATFQCWLKLVSGNGAFLLAAYNQAGTKIAADIPITVTGSWTRFSITFTGAPVSTFLVIHITKASPTTASVIDATGFMLIDGSSPLSIFNAGHDTNFGDNISAYLAQATWSWGIQQYGEKIAQPAQLTAVLNDAGGDWRPSAFYGGHLSKGCLVRLQATFDGLVYPLFIGTLASFKVDPGTVGNRTAVLTVEDSMLMLQDADYLPALMLNVTTDAVIQAVFDDSVIDWPYPGHGWLLEVVGYSELDQNTYLYFPVPTSFEVGDTTLAFAGDITDGKQAVNALQHISEATYAELGGRFWFDPTVDEYRYTNRSHDTLYAQTLNTDTFTPTDDAHVRSDLPTTNAGSGALLFSRGGGTIIIALVMFDVTRITGLVLSATLRLWVASGSADAGTVYASATSWDETTVTYNTRPAQTSSALNTPGTATTGTWVEVDVTAAVTGNGTFSFRIESALSTLLQYSSKEGVAAPQLVIESWPTSAGQPYQLNDGEQESPPVFVWGNDVVNQVTIGYYPRTIGAIASVMYRGGNLPMSLSAGEQRLFSARYNDTGSATDTIAGQDMIRPVANLDYVANAAEDGTGADTTDDLTVYAVFGATGADITLVNTSGATLYITTLQLRGTPIVAHERVTTIARDGLSQAEQGLHQQSIDLPALGDSLLAEDFANYLVQRYKLPYGRFEEVTTGLNRDDSAMSYGLTLGPGDYVAVYDAWLDNDTTQYVIIGVRHNLKSINYHDKTYILEPVDRSIFWILDDATFSVLDSTTRLGI